ncbi:MAG: DUF2169 domain-containing protein [Polyangiaceae bacterium]
MIHPTPLANPGPFGASSVLVTDAHGRDQVLTVIKLGWRAPKGGLPELPGPAEVRFAAQPYEVKPAAPIQFPSDLAPHKPGTELLLNGHARHPAAFPDARWVDVTLAVSGEALLLKKALRVFGPRVWSGTASAPVPSEPGRFQDTPLRWEWAYGGSGPTGAHPRNPIGRGFGAVLGEACHRLQDPRQIAQQTEYSPVGFGAISAHWEPRRSRRGTVQSEGHIDAPYPPSDRDPRHYCSAPDDQWLAAPLAGDESITVSGVDSVHAWRVELPRLTPELTYVLSGKPHRATPHLDTVLLDADDDWVELTWRVSFAAPRVLGELELLSVEPTALPERRAVTKAA